MLDRYINPPKININNHTCLNCGLCAKICPTRIFKFNEDKLITTTHSEECVLCGQCICGCTSGSIIHSGFDLTRFQPIKNKKNIPAEIAFDFLSQRRSLRNYKYDIPSDEILESIVKIAGFAPGSPHHRIGWIRNITIVSGYENMGKVLDLTIEYMEGIRKILSGWMIKKVAKFSASAKAGLEVLPDFEMRLREYAKGIDIVTYNAPVALFFHAPEHSSTPQTDCDTAALIVQLYASTYGLGTCWNGLIQGAAAGDHLPKFKKLSNFLSISQGHKCYAAMTIGYPSVELHSLPEREVNITWKKN